MLNISPYSFEYANIVINIAREAAKKGHTVKIYLNVDGAYNPLKFIKPPLPEERNIAKLLKKLTSLGVDIKVCSVRVEYRGQRLKEPY